MKIERGHYRMRNGHIARVRTSKSFDAIESISRKPTKVIFWFGRCEVCNEGCSWNEHGLYSVNQKHGNDLVARIEKTPAKRMAGA